MLVVIPDAQFPDAAEIERAAASGIAFSVHRTGARAGIPDEEWRRCEGIICYHELAFTPDRLARLDRCRVIVRAGVGYDNVDLEAAGRLGIAVCNVPDYGTTDVADHAIAMMLTLARGTAAYDALLRADPVQGWRFDAPPVLRRLRGRRFGVVGLGRIGLAAARRARAFDMEIAFYDPYLPSGIELALGFTRARTLSELVEAADVLSLHAPLTEETRGMIGAAALAVAKPGQIVINTGRGAVIDIDALADALRDGRIAAAALDVLPVEPPDADHPLIAAWRKGEDWIANRLLISPHAAFYSPDSIVDLRRKSAEAVASGLCANRLLNCVNRPWLSDRRGWPSGS